MARKLSDVTGTIHRAFTLIELLVVIAISAMLAAILLPTVAKSKYQSLVTNCTSNFRQWGVVANLYANNYNSFLPGFGAVGYGGNPWDANMSLIPALAPFGLTVPMWYCPVRPSDFANASATYQATYGHPLMTIADLELAAVSSTDPGEDRMVHNYWVKRQGGETSSGYYPNFDGGSAKYQSQTDAGRYGWPYKISDIGISRVPFISDLCYYTLPIVTTVTPPWFNAPPVISGQTVSMAHYFNGCLHRSEFEFRRWPCLESAAAGN